MAADGEAVGPVSTVREVLALPRDVLVRLAYGMVFAFFVIGVVE